MAEAKVDLKEDRLFPCGWGLIYRVVCAPKDWTPERVGEQATRDDPPGTSVNRWNVATPHSREDDFSGVNHLPCPDDPDRVHWLINC
jgi:hypothetical protein